MKKATYQTIVKLFPILVGISVILGMILDSTIIPLIVVGIAVPLIIWSKKNVQEVIEDKRDKRVMRNAVVLFALLATIIGLILYAKDWEGKLVVSHTLLGSVPFILINYI